MFRKLSATTIALALTVASASVGMIGMARQIEALEEENSALARMLTPAEQRVVMEWLANDGHCTDCGTED